MAEKDKKVEKAGKAEKDESEKARRAGNEKGGNERVRE
jgi:hypothetical protein